MREGQANIGKRGTLRARVWLALLGAAIVTSPGVAAQEREQGAGVTSSAPQRNSPTIVIGFLGGYVSRNSPIRSEVQLAERLRRAYPQAQDVRVETLENRKVNGAYREILKFIADGRPEPPSGQQKQTARIILYGHSWGGTAVVALARQLAKEGIPVLLTVQVDSVKHWGVDDSIIPANVAKAANFYQSNGLLRGRKEIRAADPEHTRILGNIGYDYIKHPVECKGYPFWDRWFAKTHMEIECDPKVWGQVESLIRAELGPPKAQLAAN